MFNVMFVIVVIHCKQQGVANNSTRSYNDTLMLIDYIFGCWRWPTTLLAKLVKSVEYCE